MSQQRPVPQPDLDSAPYWEAAKARKFLVPKCAACGNRFFPPRHYCPKCASDRVELVGVRGTGKVYSYCIMHDTFVPGVKPPLAIAQIELDDQPGLRITANVLECDPQEVHIGMPVEVTFEEVSPEVVLPQFRSKRS